VNYRNHWFWIDDNDLASKHVFSLIMMLFTMIDTGPQQNQPGTDDSCALAGRGELGVWRA